MENFRSMQKGASLSVENPVENNAAGTKQAYVKPQSEVVKMELEQPILNVSVEDGKREEW